MEITTTTIREKKANSNRISRNAQFTLCGSCYWCASYLDGRGIEKCPACGEQGVELMPLAGNEMYTFDYEEKRGVTVDFIPFKIAA